MKNLMITLLAICVLVFLGILISGIDNTSAVTPYTYIFISSGVLGIIFVLMIIKICKNGKNNNKKV